MLTIMQDLFRGRQQLLILFPTVLHDDNEILRLFEFASAYRLSHRHTHAAYTYQRCAFHQEDRR